MRTQALIFTATLLFARASASVVPPRTGTIATECTNVRITVENWLVGDCLTGDGTTRITSGTYLHNKIGNDDGTLVWGENGGFSDSCPRGNCELKDGGSILSCTCWTADGPGVTRDTILSLDEHIGVYKGHLLSNLVRPPVVPSKPSVYPIPDVLWYGINGNATCVVDNPQFPGWCSRVAPQCTPAEPTSFFGDPIQLLAPISRCWQPIVHYEEEKFQFSEIKFGSEAAWEMTVYADDECKRELGKIGPEEFGKCQSYGTEKIRGVIVKPLFNGDPQ